MIPAYEELLNAHARWDGKHRGVGYEISYWGHGNMCDGNGIWNGYVLLHEAMFLPDDWQRFVMPFRESEWGGKISKGWDYDRFPVCVGNGITFYKIETKWDRYCGRDIQVVKAGCDYAHLWDQERGYPAGLESVTRDMQRTIDRILELCPTHNERCAYTGEWAPSEQMYTARNGARCKIGCGADGPHWQPVELAS